MKNKKSLDTGQKLYRLQDSQNDDGTINLELAEWREDDNTVHFHFLDPLGDEHHVSCDMPRSTKEDNFFNDILEHTGWEYSTAEGNLEGERIPAKPVNQGYDILPEKVTRLNAFKNTVRNYWDSETSGDDPSKLISIILFPLYWVVGIFVYSQVDNEGKWYITGGFGALLWVVAILLLIIFL